MTPKGVAIIGGAVLSEIAASGALFSWFTGKPLIGGIYWAIETASTVGYGDVYPRGRAAHILAMFVMLTAVPLLGALFASITSLHITRKVNATEQRINDRLDAHHEALKEHVTNVAVTATAVATEESK